MDSDESANNTDQSSNQALLTRLAERTATSARPGLCSRFGIETSHRRKAGQLKLCIAGRPVAHNSVNSGRADCSRTRATRRERGHDSLTLTLPASLFGLRAQRTI